MTAKPTAIARATRVLMQYQIDWINDAAQVKVCEKGRRIGLSYAEAADDVLYAAGVDGANVYYISYNKEMTQGFIQDCATWARAFNAAASQVGESVIEEDGKQILSYTIRFDSGHMIQTFTSAPRNLRSKGRPGERLVIDEAAFVDDLKELLKAAMAMTMWGGQIRIISTHDGADNPFAELVNDVRAGRYHHSLHRITFDDALRDGLFKKICAVTGREWSLEAEAAWRQEIINRYRPNEDEELFCIPAQGGGAWLTRALVESRMTPAPVIRFTGTEAFNNATPELRAREMQDWIDEYLKPLLAFDVNLRHALGMDFARSGDLSSIAPSEIASNLHLRIPFIVELKNVPYNQQLQVLYAIADALPRLCGMVIDSRGNGSYVGEAARDKYGAVVERLMPSEGWYRDHMPPYKAALEDGTLALPLHDGLLQGHRAIRLIRGVPRMPEGKTADGSHGDSTMACIYSYAASSMDYGPIEFTPAPSHPRGFDNLTGTAPRFAMRADEQYAGDDFAVPEHQATW